MQNTEDTSRHLIISVELDLIKSTMWLKDDISPFDSSVFESGMTDNSKSVRCREPYVIQVDYLPGK